MKKLASIAITTMLVLTTVSTFLPGNILAASGNISVIPEISAPVNNGSVAIAGATMEDGTTDVGAGSATISTGGEPGREDEYLSPGPYDPVVTTNEASDINTTSARLNGYLVDIGVEGEGQYAIVSFEWGETQGGPYPYETPLQYQTDTGPFDRVLTELTTDTTYYFRAKADGDFGSLSGIVYGEEKSFTPSAQAPSVTTNDAYRIGANSARLHGVLTDLGSAASATLSFEWGLDEGGPFTEVVIGSTSNIPQEYFYDLSSLDPVTTYYFRTKAVTADGTGLGEVNSFTTRTIPPAVSTEEATDITINSARLNGWLESLGTASSADISFEWGTSPDHLDYETAQQTTTSGGLFYFDLSGLNHATDYYYRVKVIGDATFNRNKRRQAFEI